MAVKRRAGAEAISVSSSDGSGSGGDFVWTPEREAELLEALICHKPAGLAKHFQMALLVSRLQVCPLAQFYNLYYVGEGVPGHCLKRLTRTPVLCFSVDMDFLGAGENREMIIMYT